MFGGIIVALLGKMALPFDAVVLSGVLISIAGMFLVAAYPLLRRSARPRQIVPDASPGQLPSAEATNKLPPIGVTDFVPSVTEDTTNLLKMPSVDRIKQ
jgi:hypothetical protein